MVTSAALQELQAFRSELYDCCTRHRDALFELVDALLTADSIPSLAYLSLEPIHRRGWGSTYAALATGQVDAEALRTLLARQQLAGGQPIYAVDVSTWPRCDAEASPERASTTTRRGTLLVSQLSPGGRFSGSLSWGWPLTAGPPGRHAPAAPTRQRQPGRHHPGCALVGDCPAARGPCLCSTPATTPFSSAKGWPALAR
jgi:hypothetical protein